MFIIDNEYHYYPPQPRVHTYITNYACTQKCPALPLVLVAGEDWRQVSLSYLQQSEVQPLPPPPKKVAVVAVVAPSTSASPEGT